MLTRAGRPDGVPMIQKHANSRLMSCYCNIQAGPPSKFCNSSWSPCHWDTIRLYVLHDQSLCQTLHSSETHINMHNSHHVTYHRGSVALAAV